MMKTISGYILVKLLGWKMKGVFPDVEKSIVIFAPHTSYYDAFYGKLCLNELGINHKFLSKKELFFFPMNHLLKLYGSIPVRGVKGENAIFKVVNMLDESKSLHIILSPEGTFAKTPKWDKGFYYMACRANVPILVAYLDYTKREIRIKGSIYDLQDLNSVIQKINIMYEDVHAKYPVKFSINLLS